MPIVIPFSDEQARALISLRQRYEVWMEAEQAFHELPYDLRRKHVGGHDYLYEIFDRGGNGKSLGRWTAEAEARFDDYRRRKGDAKTRREVSRPTMTEAARICRALRVPLLASDAGEILREADRRGLLGERLLVVGTNAMPAYALEAGGAIRDAPDETQDFDLAWSSDSPADGDIVWRMLKAVDPTYTVNMERNFQARNAKAYEVEVLTAPSRAATAGKSDRPTPVVLPEQEWLLLGRPVDQVVACRDGEAARIVAPDPRWFALHKLWMAAKPERHPLKKPKDLKQGRALLNAVHEAMPQYALDAAFEAEMPEALRQHYEAWRDSLAAASVP